MILALWPTIRPKVANSCAHRWHCDGASFSNRAFMFGVSDPADAPIVMDAMQSFQDRGKFDAPPSFPHGMVVITDPKQTGVTFTATKMTTHPVIDTLRNDDIVVLASDDFSAPKGWDLHLVEQYKGDFNGALIVNDGYKKGTNIVPLPVVSVGFLRRLNNIVYHPAYHHFYSDQEFFDIVTEIGQVKDLRGTDAPVFNHKHWSFSGRDRDEFDDRNTRHWDADKALYEKRRNLTLAEKLTLPDDWK